MIDLNAQKTNKKNHTDKHTYGEYAPVSRCNCLRSHFLICMYVCKSSHILLYCMNIALNIIFVTMYVLYVVSDGRKSLNYFIFEAGT